MSDDPEKSQQRPARRYAYLPYLTWSLLLLLFSWFLIWLLIYRPTTQEQRMVASFAYALRYIPKAYVEQVDEAKLHQAAMEGMVQSLGDRHSAYLTPEQMRFLDVETRGEFGGIGVTVMQKDGLPLVTEVQEDGPASRAGIQAGDLITHAGGRDLGELSLDKAIDLIRGKVGTEVEIGLLRPATKERFVRKLTREKISLPNVQWEMLEDGIGKLRLLLFDESAADKMEDALRELNEHGMRALILDLRGNNGGLVDQAIRVCDMFLSKGEILSQKTRHKQLRKTREASPSVRVAQDVPIVVLVDGGTASSAEIVAGALQANGRATLAGAKTVGKGSVNEVVSLPDGSGLSIIVSYYELAGGRVIEGQGLEPDVVVGEMPPLAKEPGPQDVEAWRKLYAESKEEQLRKAVEILRQKLTGSEPPAPGASN